MHWSHSCNFKWLKVLAVVTTMVASLDYSVTSKPLFFIVQIPLWKPRRWWRGVGRQPDWSRGSRSTSWSTLQSQWPSSSSSSEHTESNRQVETTITSWQHKRVNSSSTTSVFLNHRLLPKHSAREWLSNSITKWYKTCYKFVVSCRFVHCRHWIYLI